mgnify:CR=1 FL=1
MSLLTRFGESLNDSDWMNNPEHYLGPNYQAVIDWWTYYDHLNYGKRNYIQTVIQTVSTNCIIEWLYYEIIPHRIANCMRGIMDNHNLRFISYELIAMHELLERNYEFPYIKLLEQL